MMAAAVRPRRPCASVVDALSRQRLSSLRRRSSQRRLRRSTSCRAAASSRSGRSRPAGWHKTESTTKQAISFDPLRRSGLSPPSRRSHRECSSRACFARRPRSQFPRRGALPDRRSRRRPAARPATDPLLSIGGGGPRMIRLGCPDAPTSWVSFRRPPNLQGGFRNPAKFSAGEAMDAKIDALDAALGEVGRKRTAALSEASWSSTRIARSQRSRTMTSSGSGRTWPRPGRPTCSWDRPAR